MSRIGNDSYSLRCIASDGSRCPTDNGGHLLAAFFITEAVSAMLSEPACAAILARIDQEQQFGAWGYCSQAPIDADDTAFALRTARKLGKPIRTDPLDIFFHDGAYTTFELGPHQEASRLAFDVNVPNNFVVHPEVLANVYSVLTEAGRGERIDETLICASQAPEGYFRSYFYPSQYYGTWMALDLLRKSGRLREERGKAMQFISASQNADGSWGRPGNAYETALALDAGRDQLSRFALKKAITFLLGSQRSDGSWGAPVPIWEFRYKDAPVVTWRAYDGYRVVTSALVLRALSLRYS